MDNAMIHSTAWVDDFLKLSTSEMVKENRRLIDDLKRRTTALEERFGITKKVVVDTKNSL